MTTAVLIQTIITVASFQSLLVPHPTEVAFSPPPQEVLAQEIVSSPRPTLTLSPTPTHITYTTKPGDTIRKIAREQYGSELYWSVIWNDNTELTDPAVIHSGLTLVIRTSTPSEVEELARAIPSKAPTPTPESDVDTEVATVFQEAIQTGSPVGNFASTYIEAGIKYGIPWQILYAMHKVESGLHDGPVDSGVGPQGPLQFLPSTWTLHGVDGNGDGQADINSAVDAIYSAANYLSKHPTIEAGLNSYGRIKDDVFRIAQENGWTQ